MPARKKLCDDKEVFNQVAKDTGRPRAWKVKLDKFGMGSRVSN